MNGSLNAYEKLIGEDQDSSCDRFTERENLVLFYSNEFWNEYSGDSVADTLQDAMYYLRKVTNLNPTQYFFNSRVVIRWMKDRTKNGKAGWSSDPERKGHWVDLSWDYTCKPNEPFKVCAHELVHPFYRVSPLHTRGKPWGGNEGWGEGFCDFLRGPVMCVMGLDGTEWWRKMIDATEHNRPGISWNPAGQLIKMAEERCHGITRTNQFLKWFIGNEERVKQFVTSLFEDFTDRPLSSVLRPTPEMEESYRAKLMI